MPSSERHQRKQKTPHHIRLLYVIPFLENYVLKLQFHISLNDVKPIIQSVGSY